jgi:hypothetical protein
MVYMCESSEVTMADICFHVDLIFTDSCEQNESLLQQQLQLAQTTVFESELFHEVSVTWIKICSSIPHSFISFFWY